MTPTAEATQLIEREQQHDDRKLGIEAERVNRFQQSSFHELHTVCTVSHSLSQP